MGQTARLFMNGRSQAVRLPAEFRFAGKEVHIRRDPESGDVILSDKPKRVDWDAFFARTTPSAVPNDFMGPEDRDKSFGPSRGVFDDWEE